MMSQSDSYKFNLVFVFELGLFTNTSQQTLLSVIVLKLSLLNVLPSPRFHQICIKIYCDENSN